jgi:hypothetical protein
MKFSYFELMYVYKYILIKIKWIMLLQDGYF